MPFLWIMACSLLMSVSDKEIMYFFGLAIVSHLFTFMIPYITVFIKQTVLEFPQFYPQNSQSALLIMHNFQKMPKI